MIISLEWRLPKQIFIFYDFTAPLQDKWNIKGVLNMLARWSQHVFPFLPNYAFAKYMTNSTWPLLFILPHQTCFRMKLESYLSSMCCLTHDMWHKTQDWLIRINFWSQYFWSCSQILQAKFNLSLYPKWPSCISCFTARHCSYKMKTPDKYMISELGK